MERTFNYDIMDDIKKRWSPRAFSNKNVPDEEIKALLEAARYAPSCNNEQPWRFLIASEEETLAKMRQTLNPGNREWADQAPVLILVAAAKDFQKTAKENRWNCFDAGAAWGYFSLEAQRRGLVAHAMGGFNADKAREAFSIADQLEIITIIALGYYGDPGNLSEYNQGREKPNTRKDFDELLL